jgi:hypothetical protein
MDGCGLSLSPPATAHVAAYAHCKGKYFHHLPTNHRHTGMTDHGHAHNDRSAKPHAQHVSSRIEDKVIFDHRS